MPQLYDMIQQGMSGGNPMQPSQTPSTLQPMSAEPATRNMSGIAQSVMQNLGQMGGAPQMPPGAQ